MRADGAALDVDRLEVVLPGGAGVGPVDLRLGAGEQVLVLGPSGAGKSTLLRALHGAVPQVVPADVTGTVAVGGRAVAGSRAADGRWDGEAVAALADVVGVLAQDPATGVCLPDVDDEVAFPLENLGVPPAAIGPAVTAALAATGAAHLAHRRTDALSGGELQRVALAAAVAPGPPLLLLDEPTSMLDGSGVEDVRAALRTARAAAGVSGAACVLVEHRLDDLAGDDGLAGLPDRWLVLDRAGRVRHDGPAAEVAAVATRDLVALGCWLPHEVELAALLGGPVGDPGHQRQVLDLAARVGLPSAATRGTAPVPPADLVARGVAVGPPAAPGRRARTAVLADVDLTLRPGEVVALVGPNGSGKSTLLTCLAQLTPPLAGSVTGPRAGLVFQRPEVQLTRTTVRAEVAVGLPPGPATDARVAAELDRFDLTRHADRHPHRLSGGEQRRLSLAAALVHDRPYLLADEPTFGLDRHGSTATLRALTGAAAGGRGVLLTSHDLRAVAGCADRVLVVADGRLHADVDPLTLLRTPALLTAARLRVPPLLRWFAEAVDGPERLRATLTALDDRALALADDRSPALADDRAVGAEGAR